MRPHPSHAPSLRHDAAIAQASGTPAEVYQQRGATFAQLRDQARGATYRAANLTVLAFFGALICGVIGGIRGSAPLLALTGALAVGFVTGFVLQGRLDARYRRIKELCAINEEGIARLARDWDTLPLRQPPEGAPASSLAEDLDLFGRASLQHLLSNAGTGVGQATLQRWLLEPAAPEAIRARQSAVAELAPQVDLREELAVDGRLMSEAQTSYVRFLEWAEGAPWLRSRPWLVWLTRLLTLMTLVSILLSILQVARYPFWLAFVALNILVVAAFGKPVEHVLDAVAERERAFAPYAEVYHLLMTHPFEAPALRQLQGRLNEGGPRADVEMRRLGRIMGYADLRRSMFFPIIQALTLWNFHVAWFLEGWQQISGRRARGWLLALGEADALAALAALAFDAPDWCFPTITEGGALELNARALGHPLLPPETCIRNDVVVGPPGTLLLVTGSNMSGKSTLLRALGTNIALAQAGGPVCAGELALPPVRLATSIRVRDSLEQGVSYFLAELRRLKEVVDAADEAHRDGGPVLLFLLDEILHGTNTSERQIAARRILKHLLAQGAIGAVSTHDLTLADSSEITGAARQVHFTETFTRGPEGARMTFDYKLRPGLATSTNALKLMEIVGLDV